MKTLLAALLFPIASFANDQATCDVTFSPKGGATAQTVALIGSATKTINVMTYQFTSTEIVNALLAAKNKGVAVQVIVDRSQLTSRGSKIQQAALAGIPVRVDKKHAIQHNKVILVDTTKFQTGSFNFSRNAEISNAENALICISPPLVAKYQADWNTHWAHAVPYDAK